MKVSDVLKQAREEVQNVPEGRNFPDYVAINFVCDRLRGRLVTEAQRFLELADGDFTSAIILAKEDEI